MERALLQGERQAELDQIEAETDIIAQLQHKLDELESAIQREKDKVRSFQILSISGGFGRKKHTLHSLPVLFHSSKHSSLFSYIPFWSDTVGVFTWVSFSCPYQASLTHRIECFAQFQIKAVL